MKNIFTLTLIIFSILINAQNFIEFKSQYFPNKKYEIENYTNSKSYINFEGDEGFVNALKEKGIELPIISESSIIAISETETKVQTNNNLPYITQYKKVTKTQNVNGTETTVPDTLEGSRIYGFFENGKNVKIDSIQSDILDIETKRILKDVIEKTTENINYPDKPLKIGDAFEQNIPMEFPLANLGEISFIINTKYVLKEVRDKNAYFNTTIDFILTSQIPEVKLESYGSGTGIVEYNIKDKLTTKNSSKYTLEMIAIKDNLKIQIKSDAESKYIIKIKN